MREPVEFGYAAAEVASFDGIGGECEPAVVTLKCFPVASHATEQVRSGSMIKMIRIEFAGGAEPVDQR